MTSAEKKAYREAQEFLGWDDAEVASFFRYRTLDSFRRSSAYDKRRLWFTELVNLARVKAEEYWSERVEEEKAKFEELVSGLKEFTKT